MKRLPALLVALLVVSATSSAQLRWGFGAQGGVSIGVFESAIKDYYGLGFGGGVHVDADVGKYFTGRFQFDYHMFPSDKDKIAGDLAQANQVPASDIKFEGLNINIMGFYLNGLGKLPTGSAFTPYALAGFGMNILSQSDPKVTYQGQAVTVTGFNTETKTKFGIDFGAGAEYAVSRNICLGLEFRYVLIFTENNSNAHMPISFTFTYHP